MNKQNISCIIVRRISLYNLNINMVIAKSIIEILKDICVSVSNNRIVDISPQRYKTYESEGNCTGSVFRSHGGDLALGICRVLKKLVRTSGNQVIFLNTSKSQLRILSVPLSG